MDSGEENNIKKIINCIDREELVQLACDLVNIESYTGQERQVAEFILNWFRTNGLETAAQEIDKDKLNAVGILKGSGGGLSLMINGHMDVSFHGSPEEYWTRGPLRREFIPKAVVEGGVIYGSDIMNMKASLAAFMMAAKAIKKSGIKLKGDLILAAVAGEIGRAPVDEFQGPNYIGMGVGTRHLLTHGIIPDQAIVAEASNFRVTWAQPGAIYLKITTYGELAYIPFTKHTKPEESGNAIVKMAKIIDIIEKWAPGYEERSKYEFSGGLITPKVNIGAIRGGLPYYPNHSPAVCSIYVDVRIPPGKRLDDVKLELEALFKNAKINCSVEMFLSQPGFEGKNAANLVQAAKDAYRKVFKKEMGKIPPEHTSFDTDVNIFNEMGIPAIKFGPCTDAYGQQRIDDIIKMAKLYVMMAVKICNQKRLSQ